MHSPPLYATRRRAERPTTGAHVAVIASLLGVELQPWQRHVVDVAGELIPDPELVGEVEAPPLVHAYSTVSLAVGRRAGKSLLTLARILATVIADRRRYAYYTAQNGKAAAERFRNDWVPLVESSPPVLRDRFTKRLTNGTETLTATDLASYLRIFSPIPTALHGDAADLVVLDEVWSFDLSRLLDIEVAAYPLTATRPGAQVWKLSAAGDIDSTGWIRDLDDGRAAALADTGTGRCHVEWTIEGTDLDPADEDTWIAAHPGVRHPGNPTGVVSLGFLRNEYDRDPGQFTRSYLNVTDRTGLTSSPIDVDAWNLLAVDPPDRADDIMTLGVDVEVEHRSTSIVACIGRIVELVDVRPGHEWVTARVAELVDRYPVHAVALDVGGTSPAAVLDRPFRRAGIPVEALDLADATAAAADLVAAIRSATVRHVARPELDDAIRNARRRPVGDGSWLFGRLGADSNVSPLIAAAYARYVHPETFGDTATGIH